MNTVVKRPNPMKNDSGIGIKNIKRRLDLLYPDDYTLDIEESEELFTVKLEIKLKE